MGTIGHGVDLRVGDWAKVTGGDKPVLLHFNCKCYFKNRTYE